MITSRYRGPHSFCWHLGNPELYSDGVIFPWAYDRIDAEVCGARSDCISQLCTCISPQCTHPKPYPTSLNMRLLTRGSLWVPMNFVSVNIKRNSLAKRSIDKRRHTRSNVLVKGDKSGLGKLHCHCVARNYVAEGDIEEHARIGTSFLLFYLGW